MARRPRVQSPDEEALRRAGNLSGLSAPRAARRGNWSAPMDPPRRGETPWRAPVRAAFGTVPEGRSDVPEDARAWDGDTDPLSGCRNRRPEGPRRPARARRPSRPGLP